MKIIVTGAAGGIGSTLSHRLHKEGHDLLLVDNFRNGYRENLTIDGQTFGTLYEVDITDEKQLESVPFAGADCVIHLAAVTSLADCEAHPIEAYNVNVMGTLNVLEKSRRAGIPHVIFSSTSAVYENNKEATFTEDLPVSPHLSYSLTKKMAEDLVASYRSKYDMTITVLRFFNVFGPRQDIHRKSPPLLNYLVKELSAGRIPMLHSDGLQQRDYIHVDDVVRLVDACLVQKPNDNFNVCTGKLLSVLEIVDLVRSALGTDLKPAFRDAAMLFDCYPELFSGRFPLKRAIVAAETNKFSRGSYDKAQRVLNWTPNTDLPSLFKSVVEDMVQRLAA